MGNGIWVVIVNNGKSREQFTVDSAPRAHAECEYFLRRNYGGFNNPDPTAMVNIRLRELDAEYAQCPNHFWAGELDDGGFIVEAYRVGSYYAERC